MINSFFVKEGDDVRCQLGAVGSVNVRHATVVGRHRFMACVQACVDIVQMRNSP
jgi:hypothetical protein